MRSRHHHPYHTLKEWHAGQREKRKQERWIPYSLRWEGGAFTKILPQVCFPIRDILLQSLEEYYHLHRGDV